MTSADSLLFLTDKIKEAYLAQESRAVTLGDITANLIYKKRDENGDVLSRGQNEIMEYLAVSTTSALIYQRSSEQRTLFSIDDKKSVLSLVKELMADSSVRYGDENKDLLFLPSSFDEKCEIGSRHLSARSIAYSLDESYIRSGSYYYFSDGIHIIRSSCRPHKISVPFMFVGYGKNDYETMYTLIPDVKAIFHHSKHPDINLYERLRRDVYLQGLLGKDVAALVEQDLRLP